MRQERNCNFYGYLFLLLLLSLVTVVTGCSESEPSSDTSLNDPSLKLQSEDIVASAGPIIAVRVGETATLDGSDSFSRVGGGLMFEWSFSSKPDLSTAELQNPRSMNPSFVADVKGTYMVQLVVSTSNLRSGRTIALVEATNPGERRTGPYIHLNLSSSQ